MTDPADPAHDPVLGHLRLRAIRVQQLWQQLEADPPRRDLPELIVRIVAEFSAAWYLRYLHVAHPATALAAYEGLKRALLDPDDVGARIWELLERVGVDPETVEPWPWPAEKHPFHDLVYPEDAHRLYRAGPGEP